MSSIYSNIDARKNAANSTGIFGLFKIIFCFALLLFALQITVQCQAIGTTSSGPVITLYDKAGTANGTLHGFALTGSTSNWVAGGTSGTCAVYTAPAVSIIATGPTGLCQGDYVALKAIPENAATPGYQWYKDAISISGATTGTFTAIEAGSYSVTVTNNGCSATSAATIVTVKALPTATISGTTSLCGGASATLIITSSGNGSVSGTLSDGTAFSGTAPTISVQVSPDANTTYTIASLTNGTCNAGSTGLTGSATITLNGKPIVSAENYTATADVNCGASVTFAATATGTPMPSITYTIGNTVISSPYNFSTGVTTVTATAANSCGTDTKTFTVTISDNTLPTITAPVDKTVNMDVGRCTASLINAAIGTATFGDNCPGVTVTNNAPVQFVKGATSVIWTATDASGNTATCTQQVTVTDNEKPIIICPAAKTATNDAGKCGATVQLGSPTVSDNCSATATSNAPANNFYPVGTTTVTWTSTDASGNTATCTQQVTVTDNEKPTMICPADKTATNDAGKCGATVQLGSPTVSDNCSATVTSNAPANKFYPVGTTTVTWTATDASGNTATCTQQVTVTDNEKPIIICPADKTVNPTSLSGAVVTYSSPTYSDNCPGSTVSSTGPASGSTFPIGTTMVSYTVTDASRNSASCSFKVTVKDPYCDRSLKNEKVYVCHNGQTICIGVNALQTHMSHGDYLGACTTNSITSTASARASNLEVAILKPAMSLPSGFRLSNYPNPFAASTTIKYELPVDSKVSLKVYNAHGQSITTLFEGNRKAGFYTVSFNASKLAFGGYYCQLVATSEKQQSLQSIKLVVIK